MNILNPLYLLSYTTFNWLGAAIGIAGLGASIWGTSSARSGQREANAMNAHQAQLNRDFQERMSSTSAQRGVADMKKAGLSPILAAGGGGASSPSGAQAQMQSETAESSKLLAGTVATASEARRAFLEAKQTKASTKVIKKTKKKIVADTYETRTRTNTHQAQTMKLNQDKKTSQAQERSYVLENQFLSQANKLKLKQLKADTKYNLKYISKKNPTLDYVLDKLHQGKGTAKTLLRTK